MSPELADRTKQLRGLMTERDHLEGCPAKRVESYPDRKPAKPDQGIAAREVSVVHCCDCGGTKVIDEPHGDLLERLDADDPTKEAANGKQEEGGDGSQGQSPQEGGSGWFGRS